MAPIRFHGKISAGRILTRSEADDLMDRLAGVLALHAGRVVSRSSAALNVSFTRWPLVSNWDVMAGVTRGELRVDAWDGTVHYTFYESPLLTAVQLGAPVFFAVLIMVLVDRLLLGALAFVLLSWMLFFCAHVLAGARIRSLVTSVVASA